MGKRFEGAHPTFIDVLAGYRLLGLEEVIGQLGPNTAFTTTGCSTNDKIELHVVPGHFSAEQVLELLCDARMP
jgi:hypothetical protein